jgi:type II secretory pathway pseudopilin PulG
MLRNQSPRAFGAFGLIAILVVLVIVLLLYFGNAGNGSYSQQLSQTRKQGRNLAFQINAQQLTLLIATYKQNNGRLPRTWEEMEAPPASYTDAWGKPLTFTIEENRRTGRTTITYRSSGPDEEPGTDDDIVTTDDLPL